MCMRRNFVRSLLLSGCLSALLAAAPVRAQTCPSVKESHPVWQAIGAQYASLAEALKRKDLDALVALYSATVGAITPNGEVWDREKALAYQRNGLAQVKQTEHISNTILHLKVCGDEAVATVLQRWNRDQWMGGKLRHMETSAIQDEHWTKGPGGWKRGMIEDVVEGAAFIDGKRFDTSTTYDGYDPEAPEYDPDDRSPKRPAVEALLPIATEKGAAAAIAAYDGLKRSNDYYVSQQQINLLGYKLLGLKRYADAVQIFEFNTKLYPQSPNVHDSLGEAYMAAGKTSRAITAYEKALRMNPKNGNAVERLRILRSKR